MSDEHNSGGPQGDEPFGGPEETTKVELGDGIVISSGRRLAVALHEAGRCVDETLDVIQAARLAGQVVGIRELKDYVAGLIPTMQGTLRALDRIEKKALQDATAKQAKERP